MDRRICMKTDAQLQPNMNSDPNLVDRAARSATQALEATRQIADSAIDSATGRVNLIRDRASPAMDRLVSPLHSASAYTRAKPLQALMVAAASGAFLVAFLGLFGRPKR
jgi:ElaB/YqjD/DUF883 family membrane-anchored ribosome-binding protein